MAWKNKYIKKKKKQQSILNKTMLAELMSKQVT